MKTLASLYLKYLNLPEKSPSMAYLCELQKQHIERIPHENINGIYNIHTSFDIPYLLNKFLIEKRGGMCFELNYAFGWLLDQIGFNVELILSDVVAYDHMKEHNEYPTHPVIIVHLDGEKFLTDAGWSNSYRHPLSLAGEEYTDQTGKYRVSNTPEGQLVMQKYLKNQEHFEWHDQFIFDQPVQALETYTYPKGFLAANAYTHVGKGYLFTSLFHFTNVSEQGQTSIWGNNLITKNIKDKTRTVAQLDGDIPSILSRQFHVEKNIADRCVKLTRSKSMLFAYKPVTEEAVFRSILDKRV